jgi:RHS repeat-associated protein
MTQFTGKERDSETGLDYFGARYYGSNMGRWMSPDEFTGGPVDVFGPNPNVKGPLPYADISNPQSLNKYHYAYNNPLRFVDPDGHEIMNYQQNCSPVEATTSGHPIRDTLILGAYTTTALFAPSFVQGALVRFVPLMTSSGASLVTARDQVSSALGKLSEAAESGAVKLSNVTQGRLQSAMNSVNEHMTNKDISGAVRDAAGVESHGEHLNEVTNAAESLGNLRTSLNGALQNPNLSQDTRQLYTNTVNALTKTINAAKDLKKQ